jgi:hypothetical protein
VVTWLNASFEMRFRLIGGLTIRFAASEDHGDHALLLSPWPESLPAARVLNDLCSPGWFDAEASGWRPKPAGDRAAAYARGQWRRHGAV